MTQVINSLRIEQNYRPNVKQENEMKSKVNLMETTNKSNFKSQFCSRGKNFKSSRKSNNHQNHHQNNQPNHHQPSHKPKVVKGKSNGKRAYFAWGRTNHIASDCYYKKIEEYKPNDNNKRGTRAQVNMLMDGENSSEPSMRYNLNSPLLILPIIIKIGS